MNANLLRKYNVPGPRYTSYPTVPHWDQEAPTVQQWLEAVDAAYARSNAKDGIALYVHLPYCESLCTYCACNTRITVNHAVEEPYIQAVLKEWDMYRNRWDTKPRLREWHFGGGTPTFFSPENLNKLIRGILSGLEIHPSHEFSFEGHPGNTTMEHLRVFYENGFRRVSFGIQDYDEQVQIAINRKQSAAQVANVVAQARQVGYTSVNFDLVYGLPFQNRAGLIKTVREVLNQRPDRIAFYGYAHVPWVKPGQRKFTEADLPNTEEKHALYQIGREMFLDAGYVDVGMDHFALPTDRLAKASAAGKLHRNFMGYTPEHTELMLGLGVSSISDAWTAFAQNRKTVEPYLKDIEEGRLPVVKGHLLTREDLIIRKHILNLMCQFKSDWSNPELVTGSLPDALVRLKEMTNDGLVQLKPDGVVVTRKGRPFVRNVCMAFDARLAQQQHGTQVFSSTV